jgi:hypothetical protein
MRRARYRIDQFRDLRREQLQSRLQSVIDLIREEFRQASIRRRVIEAELRPSAV